LDPTVTFRFDDNPEKDRAGLTHRHAATVAAIASALASADDIDGSRLQVAVTGGVVLLEGTVRSQREIDRAMEIATAIAGGMVRNRIWRED
jgi:osmotically-inducible protein OsmY